MIMFTYIDLFAGIGGFRIPLDHLGGKCVGFSEIDKTAIETYCLNYKESESNNLGDIRKIDSLPYCDILTGGISCISWSNAGKKLGFDDPRGHGLLWNDAIRCLSYSKPRYFIFENVKGLVDPRNKESFNYILSEITKQGYYYKHYLINSSDLGLKQNRERIYIIGFRDKQDYDSYNITIPNRVKYEKFFSLNDLRDGKDTIHSWDLTDTTIEQKNVCMLLLKNRRKKIYGLKDGNPLSLSDFQNLDSSIDQTLLDSLIELNILKKILYKYDFKNTKISIGINGVSRIYLKDSLFSTMTSSDSNDYICTIDIPENIDIDKQTFITDIYNKGLYRKINQQEALNFQGFPIDFKLPDNRNKWMKLIGNSVSTTVISHLLTGISNL